MSEDINVIFIANLKNNKNIWLDNTKKINKALEKGMKIHMKIIMVWNYVESENKRD